MRKLVFFVHATLDGFMAKADGDLWERFAWGEEEMAFNNDFFRTADTWVLGRRMYEVIVPWWREVARGATPEDTEHVTAGDREFAALFAGMTVVAVSRTLEEQDGTHVFGADVADRILALKQQAGKDILLSCGPALLAELAQRPALVDEYLIIVHPAALGSGKPMFGELGHELPLELVEAQSFPGGCVALRYRPGP